MSYVRGTVRPSTTGGERVWGIITCDGAGGDVLCVVYFAHCKMGFLANGSELRLTHAASSQPLHKGDSGEAGSFTAVGIQRILRCQNTYVCVPMCVCVPA